VGYCIFGARSGDGGRSEGYIYGGGGSGGDGSEELLGRRGDGEGEE